MNSALEIAFEKFNVPFLCNGVIGFHVKWIFLIFISHYRVRSLSLHYLAVDWWYRIQMSLLKKYLLNDANSIYLKENMEFESLTKVQNSWENSLSWTIFNGELLIESQTFKYIQFAILLTVCVRFNFDKN